MLLNGIIVLNAFENGIFSKRKRGKRVSILDKKNRYSIYESWEQ